MAQLTRLWVITPDFVLPGTLPTGLARVPATPPGPELGPWLAGFCEAHPGEQIIAVGEASLPATVAAWLLGIEPAAIEAGAVTLDWSPDGQGGQLIGVDLDWTPPFQPAGRSKFPGGPGVAGSARA